MDEHMFALGQIINSPANDKVKYMRSLQRRRFRYKERRFLAEGVRVLEDAVGAGHVPTLVFLGVDWAENERVAALVSKMLALTSEVYPVGRGIMNSLSDTVTPQGVLAVFPFVNVVPPAQDFLLILDGVQDPGNIGTLLRSAEAAGVGQIILASGTVDIYNPKVVRAGAGAHFRVSTLALNWQQIKDRVRDMAVCLATGDSPAAYYAIDWREPVALIVSNEGKGASRDACSVATERVAIPMQGDTESLNVAVAGSVMLFEAARQRALAR